MRAGELRHPITIQKPTETSDGIGGMTTTWSTFKSVRAAIWPLRGSEYIAAQQITSEISHKIRIRYLSGVTPKMRILFGTRLFEIISPPINPDERNIYLEIMCRETTPVKNG